MGGQSIVGPLLQYYGIFHRFTLRPFKLLHAMFNIVFICLIQDTANVLFNATVTYHAYIETIIKALLCYSYLFTVDTHSVPTNLTNNFLLLIPSL